MSENPEKGEACFIIGKGTPDEKKYVLQFTFDALEAIETETGESIEAVFTRIQDPAKRRLRDVRILVFAALREHHPEITMRLAGELILAAKTDAVYAGLSRAAELAFPSDPAEPGSDANPTEARPAIAPGIAGTGTG
jgi:hypothetical protein